MPKKEHIKKCFYITPIGDKLSPQYSKLEGLKENVICGHLIPAGTGLREYEKIIVQFFVCFTNIKNSNYLSHLLII